MQNVIIGAVIGIVVAILFCILLHYTIFKYQKMTALYLILVLLFATCGGLIQHFYFPFKTENLAVPTPQEQLQTLETTIRDGWKNTNGGFTFEQIIEAQKDSEAPTIDDQILNMKCYDFGGYIVFATENNGEYQNALFYKSSNGLILDGVINTTAVISPWFVGWFKFNLDSFTWAPYDSNMEPSYGIQWLVWQWYDDLVSISRQNIDFLINRTDWPRTNYDEMSCFVLKNAAQYTATNATNYFIRFGNLELIGTGDVGFKKINSFYNYLYEQVKGRAYNTYNMIDASSCLCYPIATELQYNYPIDEAKKSEYNNADYYGVYKCDIAVNLNYLKGNTYISTTTRNTDYINELKNDNNTKDKVEIERIEPDYLFTNVKVNFNNKQNSDLNNVNLVQNPIDITFYCENLDITKVVTIDSKSKLSSSIDVLLNANETWQYSINSEQLLFENFQGSFRVSDSNSVVTFDYLYIDNMTIASIGLNAVGSIDRDLIDLQANPVRIILTNENNTYTFIFDNNTKLDSYINSLVEVGEYSYTILSQQLVFSSTSGALTINNANRTMLFNYAAQIANDLNFTISYFDIDHSTASPSELAEWLIDGNNCMYAFTRDYSTIQTINNRYYLSFVIYDELGRAVDWCNNYDVNSYSMYNNFRFKESLNKNQTYTIQFKLSFPNSAKIYVSNVETFTCNEYYDIGIEFFVS